MEHSELLKEIDRFQSLDETSIRLSGVGIKTVTAIDSPTSRVLSNALRAVVKLHKPVQSYMFDEEACSHCSSEEDRLEILYPCPTIKAIEKELK
jgi:hypothetical protein